jgi:hemoglobin-like flavoprotein
MFAGQPLWSAFNRRADADPGARGARSGDLAETARVPPSPASPDSGAERPRPPEHRLAADTGDGDNSANHIFSFHARLVKESFAVIEPRALEAMEHFYAWLFVRHPEIRAMFPLAMSEHRERVLGALARIVWSMDSPAALDSYLRQLGRDHRKFAVKDKHYQAFFGALLDTVRHFSGDAWTADTEAAWEAALGYTARIMRAAAAADAEHAPAWWLGEIVQHDLRRRPAVHRRRDRAGADQGADRGRDRRGRASPAAEDRPVPRCAPRGCWPAGFPASTFTTTQSTRQPPEPGRAQAARCSPKNAKMRCHASAASDRWKLVLVILARTAAAPEVSVMKR